MLLWCVYCFCSLGSFLLKLFFLQIDAIRGSGVPYVILCPPMMRSAGKKTEAGINIRIDRPSTDFLSYEDAAVAMVRALDKEYDNVLITASAKQ